MVDMDTEEVDNEKVEEKKDSETKKQHKKKGRPAGAKNKATFGKSGEVRVKVRGLEFLLPRWCDTVFYL